MEIALSKEEVTNSLWGRYAATEEYKQGQNQAIPANFFMVIELEKEGARTITRSIETRLKESNNEKERLASQTVGDWLVQWKDMHKMLFGEILVKCGDWRTRMISFGDVGDEDLYKWPAPAMIVPELSVLATNISNKLRGDLRDLDDKCTFLATTHYQFIRIHPFFDGNGRIARAITDQLATVLDLPPAMGGYPRLNVGAKEKYHRAIKSCTTDPQCKGLASWIKEFIEKRIEETA